MKITTLQIIFRLDQNKLTHVMRSSVFYLGLHYTHSVYRTRCAATSRILNAGLRLVQEI